MPLTFDSTSKGVHANLGTRRPWPAGLCGGTVLHCLRGQAPYRQASARTRSRRGLHLQHPADAADLDHDSVILVEGLADRKAVQRAVTATVVVVGGTYALRGLELDIARFKRPLVSVTVLMDPDHEGRKARLLLAEKLPEALHAFVPKALAEASTTTRRHVKGNVGIEHASAQAIRLALEQARACDPTASHILREDLVARGLLADFGQAMEAAGAASKRQQLCDNLGLGSVPGKHLQKQLNMFGFTIQDVDAAMTPAAA